MTVTEKARQLKANSPRLFASSIELRNQALLMIADALLANSSTIFEANAADLKAAQEADLSAPVIKRLTFNDHKLSDVVAGIRSLVSLPDPIGKTLLHRELYSGLELYRVSCPIGVIGIIFEARPDALVQISSLCIKSGNCAFLKGGSETSNTNRVLFDIIYDTAVKAGLPENCLALCEARSEITELLSCDAYVDLLIPRGSNSFVRYIMDNTRIPVMGHADGVCHIYVDKEANLEMAHKVITDAKTQYTSVCNAVETLLIHKDIADDLLPLLHKQFAQVGVTIRGNGEFMDKLADLSLEEKDKIASSRLMGDEDYHTEYLDYIVSCKLVDDINQAIDHINRFGSHHTDCILTEDTQACDTFMQLVDSANVYHNCSTRFADGFRYGFGAEVGISTSKLHARGPVGLDGLVTYKYKLFGNGHIVRDFADGTCQFDFKDL